MFRIVSFAWSRPSLGAMLLSCVFAISPLTTTAATPGMTPGPVELMSIGPMTFATQGVLLVGDPKTATVYAIDTEDTSPVNDQRIEVKNLPAAIQAALQLDAKVELGELAVNPDSGHAFITVRAGDAVHLVKVTGGGEISQVNLDKVSHAKTQLASPPEDKEVVRRGRSRNPRDQSITDLAFFDGKVLVTGMAAGDSPSRVLEIPFPFADNAVTTSVEIFHAAHGRVEDAAIQTFLPINIDGKPSLLAGFTCTPLVRFPIGGLKGDKKVRGTTVAELGNRNTPLDMVVYEKDGKTSILMSNTARGMMKISTAGIGEQAGLEERVGNGGTAGQPFETIESLKGVIQMDKRDDQTAIVILEDSGVTALKTISLP